MRRTVVLVASIFVLGYLLPVVTANAKDPKGDTGGNYGIDIKTISARDRIPEPGVSFVFYKVTSYNKWRSADLNSDSWIKIKIDADLKGKADRVLKLTKRNGSPASAVAFSEGQKTSYKVRINRPNLRTVIFRVSSEFIQGEYVYGGWTKWWAETAWVSHRGEGICYWVGCFDRVKKKRHYVW